jgi:hypothetical protein
LRLSDSVHRASAAGWVWHVARWREKGFGRGRPCDTNRYVDGASALTHARPDRERGEGDPNQHQGLGDPTAHCACEGAHFTRWDGCVRRRSCALPLSGEAEAPSNPLSRGGDTSGHRAGCDTAPESRAVSGWWRWSPRTQTARRDSSRRRAKVGFTTGSLLAAGRCFVGVHSATWCTADSSRAKSGPARGGGTGTRAAARKTLPGHTSTVVALQRESSRRVHACHPTAAHLTLT